MSAALEQVQGMTLGARGPWFSMATSQYCLTLFFGQSQQWATSVLLSP